MGALSFALWTASSLTARPRLTLTEAARVKRVSMALSEDASVAPAEIPRKVAIRSDFAAFS